MENEQLVITLEKAKEIYGKNKELDIILEETFSKEKLTKREIKSFYDLKIISGYYINNYFGVSFIKDITTSPYRRSVFATESQAKSALSMAQLSHLMKEANGDWIANWINKEIKYCIYRFNNVAKVTMETMFYNFLAFKSAEIRDEFFLNHETLIKEYFEIID